MHIKNGKTVFIMSFWKAISVLSPSKQEIVKFAACQIKSGIATMLRPRVTPKIDNSITQLLFLKSNVGLLDAEDLAKLEGAFEIIDSVNDAVDRKIKYGN
jgi:hypothetical protein